MTENYINLLDKDIRIMFRDALKISFKNPGFLFFLLKTIINQKQAVKRRSTSKKQGIHVPPFMIFSVTNKCNLACAGCYSRFQKRTAQKEMDNLTVRKVLEQARDLGFSIVLFAGGEPLLRKDLLQIMKQFPEIIFVLFTNGLLIDAEVMTFFNRYRNIIPVISIEGDQNCNDKRRGKGVFNILIKVLQEMKTRHIFYGLSSTVTKDTFNVITAEKQIKQFIDLGSKLFFFIDYVPFEKGTDNKVLTAEQLIQLAEKVSRFKKKYSALFISFPGGEEKYGGCLAAGRGFLHISAQGDVEPCPFSPFSDVNLKDISLQQALQSKLLKVIRDNADQLEETGGCALYQKRKWVKSLL